MMVLINNIVCIEIIGKAITRDHKPSDPIEAKRIKASGGLIEELKGFN